MSTYGTAAAFFTEVLLLAVQADATATALFTLVLLPAMRADRAATALFTDVLLPPVRADATAAAVFTKVPLPSVLAFRSLPAARVARGCRAALPSQRPRFRRVPPIVQHADVCGYRRSQPLHRGQKLAHAF
jgi:hypothetical protein